MFLERESRDRSTWSQNRDMEEILHEQLLKDGGEYGRDDNDL
jgi:hypothetical protein